MSGSVFPGRCSLCHAIDFTNLIAFVSSFSSSGVIFSSGRIRHIEEGEKLYFRIGGGAFFVDYPVDKDIRDADKRGLPENVFRNRIDVQKRRIVVMFDNRADSFR